MAPDGNASWKGGLKLDGFMRRETANVRKLCDAI
jgi:hypothetical protein